MAWSKETVEELIDVLKREKFDTYLSKAERAERIQAYAHTIVFFDVTLFVNDCKDQKDNKFLALASTAQARLIVSGDKQDLLSMNPYHGIEIIGVRDFIDNYEKYVR